MGAPEKETGAGRKKLNPEIFWLVAIFLLAVVLRTLAVLTRDMVFMDETSLIRMAENLLAGRAPYEITGASATHFPILYPLVTASFAVVTRSEVVAGYIVSVFFSSLLVLPTYLFGKVMWNMRVGRAAAALVAVLPLLVQSGSLVDGQNLYAFWLLSALFFGYRMQFTKRCMCGMISGTCLGIAYLDNPSALYYLVVLFGLLVIVGFRQELANYANKAALHFILMFLLFAIPNVVFMSWMNGSFTLSDRPTDQLYAALNNLPAGSLEREQELYGLTDAGDLRLGEIEQGKGIFTSFIDSPWQFTKTVIKTDYRDYFRGAHGIVPVWLLPLIGLGLFKYAWTRREALKYGYFALVMLPLLVLPVVWGDLRFVLPYLGIVMLWAARGWVYLEEWSYDSVDDVAGWGGDEGEAAGRRKRWVQAALAVLVLAPLAALGIWNTAHNDYPVEFREAGEWLAAQAGTPEDLERPLVMSRETATAWYAGGELLALPYASIEETIDYARRNDADYFVMSRRVTDDLRPELAPLMDEDNAYGEALEPVYHAGEGTGEELIVYSVRKS